jgi:phosphoribosylformimino-5-aminoimidazole carboxamide ribonucleotide (ProFAR) isomerase
MKLIARICLVLIAMLTGAAGWINYVEYQRMHLVDLKHQFELAKENFEFNQKVTEKMPADVGVGVLIIQGGAYRQMEDARWRYNKAANHWFVPARSRDGLPAEL